jgi:hypothetical protein
LLLKELPAGAFFLLSLVQFICASLLFGSKPRFLLLFDGEQA